MTKEEYKKIYDDVHRFILESHQTIDNLASRSSKLDRKIEKLGVHLELVNDEENRKKSPKDCLIENPKNELAVSDLECELLTYEVDRLNFIFRIEENTSKANKLKGAFKEINTCIDYELVLADMKEKMSKSEKGRNTLISNTEDFWSPYRKKFDDYIESGKSKSWALDKIGCLIEDAKTWKKQSKKDPRQMVKKPDRGTLRRQLITNRK